VQDEIEKYPEVFYKNILERPVTLQESVLSYFRFISQYLDEHNAKTA
jgi:hypothetical protein